MSQEQGSGASARADRAATPSEPSQSSVVSGVADIPCAFTPGPWEVSPQGGAVWGYRIHTHEDGSAPIRVRVTVCNLTHNANTADARLLAAAPTLLTACKRWVEYLDDPERGGAGEEDALLRELRAAVKVAGQ